MCEVGLTCLQILNDRWRWMILDYTCRARWPFRAFAQESLKTVTSPTSYRKYPQKGPNLGLPRMLIFWFTFISIEIKLHLVSRGTPLFPSFLRSIGYFKAILHISGSKKRSKRSVTQHRRTDAQTDAHQNFEASCTKALRAKILACDAIRRRGF